MKNSSILVAIGKETPLGQLAKTLESLRAIPARAVILVVAEMPAFPYYAIGMAPFAPVDIPPDWQDSVADLHAALDAKAKAIDALLQEHDVSGEVTTVACETAMMGETIARQAMLCDMAIISPDLRATDMLFRQAVNGVLFQSPIGVMLNDHNCAAICAPKRVLVAWNMQIHTARAVHQALPLLLQADEVIIAAFDPVMTEFRDGEDPGADIAKWLTHHGCTVSVQQYPSGGTDIGHCILSRAKELGADVIVMGAYSHSRTREAIFGGTTQTLIDQTEQAVFLAH